MSSKLYLRSIVRFLIKENFVNKKFYYHRSTKKFDKFLVKGDKDYIKKHATDNGIYFTTSPNIKAYGNILYTVTLNIKNPLYIKNYYSDMVNPDTNKQINIEHVTDSDLYFLKKQGIDAIISQTTGQVVVFDPNIVHIIDISIE